MYNVKNFYFTYGNVGSGMPFAGGWTVVRAVDMAQAYKFFRAAHPDKTPGIINCSWIYDEDSFNATGMAVEGNYGAFEHERLGIIG